MESVTKKQVQEWCKSCWREADKTARGYVTSDVVEKAGVPKEWQTLILCALIGGYVDMEDWAAEA